MKSFRLLRRYLLFLRELLSIRLLGICRLFLILLVVDHICFHRYREYVNDMRQWIKVAIGSRVLLLIAAGY